MPVDSASLEERIVARERHLSPAQKRVGYYLAANREQAVVAPALQLAQVTGTSNATVVRVIRALGYTGMADFRRQLAAELGTNLSPAARLGRTLEEIGEDPQAVLDSVLDIHQHALDSLRREVPGSLFHAAVARLASARRILVFGIGPSGAMADYFVLQLGRIGLAARALTQTGLSLADGLHSVRGQDCLVILAYSRVYREVEAVLEVAEAHGIQCILLTDTLRAALAPRVDLILPVQRGQSRLFSMHTATLGLIEALLTGIAMERAGPALEALNELNVLRARLTQDRPHRPLGGPWQEPVSAD